MEFYKNRSIILWYSKIDAPINKVQCGPFTIDPPIYKKIGFFLQTYM